MNPLHTTQIINDLINRWKLPKLPIDHTRIVGVWGPALIKTLPTGTGWFYRSDRCTKVAVFPICSCEKGVLRKAGWMFLGDYLKDVRGSNPGYAINIGVVSENPLNVYMDCIQSWDKENLVAWLLEKRSDFKFGSLTITLPESSPKYVPNPQDTPLTRFDRLVHALLPLGLSGAPNSEFCLREARSDQSPVLTVKLHLDGRPSQLEATRHGALLWPGGTDGHLTLQDSREVEWILAVLTGEVPSCQVGSYKVEPLRPRGLYTADWDQP